MSQPTPRIALVTDSTCDIPAEWIKPYKITVVPLIFVRPDTGTVSAALAERVQREYSPKELFISIASPALGVHTRPRAIALCGYAG